MEPVIVVHGTYANGSDWWRPKSKFCKQLDQYLAALDSDARTWSGISEELAVGDFGWDGSNSETSRNQAAASLAQKLVKLLDNKEVHRVHLVAHSHGGNVLQKTLLLCRRRSNNKKLGSIIFLGTPFLLYSSIDRSHYLSAFASISLLIAIIMFEGILLSMHYLIIFLIMLIAGILLLLSTRLFYMHRYSYAIDRLASRSASYRGRCYMLSSKYDEAINLLKEAFDLKKQAASIAKSLSKIGSFKHTIMSPHLAYELQLGKLAIINVFLHKNIDEKSINTPKLIGHRNWISLIVILFFSYILNVILYPFIVTAKLLKKWSRRWAIYFGIRAIVSTAIGDDLPFEGIKNVGEDPTAVSALKITIPDDIEESMLKKAKTHHKRTIDKIYDMVDRKNDKSNFLNINKSIEMIFSMEDIVHTQYYKNDDIVKLVAKTIACPEEIDERLIGDRDQLEHMIGALQQSSSGLRRKWLWTKAPTNH